MVKAVDPTLIEDIVGIARHATEHYVRLDSKAEQVYVLHSAECLTEMGTPAEDCPYTAAQEHGILDNRGDWDGCEDQPVIVDLDDETLDDAVVLTPRWVEIDEDERFAPGVRVRVKRDAVDPGDGHLGGEYIVVGYCDKKQRDMALPYYGVDSVDPDGLLGGCIPHAALEQVMSADENAEALKMPEPGEIMLAISDALHSMFGEEISVHQSEVLTSKPDPTDRGPGFEGEHAYEHGVEFYGKTEGGRHFGGVIRLTALWDTDF